MDKIDPKNVVELRAHFAEHLAPGLAAKIDSRLALLDTDRRLSSRFVFMVNEDLLVVLAGAQEAQGDLDRALAFGLAWMGDRDLILVLPEGGEVASVHRAAFFSRHIRIFTHDGATPTEVSPLAQHQVFLLHIDPLETSVANLGDRNLWISDLLKWAATHPDLRSAHRPSYLAWHCLGRLVLRIQRVADGLQISAGVHAATPSDKYAPQITTNVNSTLEKTAEDQIQAAASEAIRRRLVGDDLDHLEHLLQARLFDCSKSIGLIKESLKREFPCMRPGPVRAYIDLIGLDKKGICHVVEVKIGGDEMLVLQGLDYYIWAKAHQKQLADYFGEDANMPIALDFVVAAPANGTAIGPYTSAQANALDGGIPWQFKVVTNWLEGQPASTTGRSRTVPSPPISSKPVVPFRFAQRIHEHLVSVAIGLKPDGFSEVNLDDHIFPEAQWAWNNIEERTLLHRWAHHIRSSQAFAINLFGPLDDKAVSTLLSDQFGLMESVERPFFEFEDATDRLNEMRQDRPHRTQVDVLLRGTAAAGKPVALLIEVKLAEEDFGTCSAFTSRINDRRHICHQKGPFGNDVDSCFQLRSHANGERRLYDKYLTGNLKLTGTETAGCWYRTSASQPMRNVALAGVLRQDGIDARYALCAPRAHREIWRRWDEVHRVLPNELLVTLPAESVLALHGSDTFTRIRDRYQLGTVESDPR